MDGKRCNPPKGVRRSHRVGKGRTVRRVYPQHCVKCGYNWESRIPCPKECPQCKNRNWKGLP